MAAQIISEVAPTATELLQVLESFTNEQFNTVPFEGSWTAGQVAEHVLKSCAGGLHNLSGPSRPADRDPAQHAQMISDMFLDFSTKMQSPEFIIPSNDPKDKAALIEALKMTWDGITAFAPANDLSLFCTAFAFPTVGELSRLEWITFLVVHTQRHIHQLKNIAAHLNQTEASI